MPLLKKLLVDASENATAEQLFASSIYAPEMRTQRQQAAAICSAPLVSMATMASRSDTSVVGSALEKLNSCSIEQCVQAALLVAREDRHVLFLVRDPKLVTKRLAVAVSSPESAMTTEVAAECLHRVRFRQIRSVNDLLRELDHVQKNWQDGQDAGIRFVALGPLCDLFSGFHTASGISTTGAGLKRMVELAVKRLRATTSVSVSVMEVDMN